MSADNRPRAFVTGGTGFIGSAFVRLLIEQGYAVRAFVRPKSPNMINLEGLDIELYEGDITDKGALMAGMEGCSCVFHLAADYRLWVPKPESMYRINVDASRLVVEAASESDIERLVYCSSVATLGTSPNGKPANEMTQSSVEDMIGHYKRSKFLGEEAAKAAAKATGQGVVYVHPSAPVGPRDIRPTPTGKMVLDGISGKLPAYMDTGLNIVHVDDVAAGILLAYNKGRNGERYILGGENLSLREIFQELADIAGCKPPKIELSPSILTPIAWSSEHLGKLFHFEPRIHMDVLRMARKRMFFSSKKAQDELGYRSRPAREALESAADWFRSNGYC